MTPRERKTWLASLKVGDEVAVISGGWLVGIRAITYRNDERIGFAHDRRDEQIGAVSAVNGRHRDSHGSRSIEPVTDEHRAVEAERAGRVRLARLPWHIALTRDQIARIVAIVDGAA